MESRGSDRKKRLKKRQTDGLKQRYRPTESKTESQRDREIDRLQNRLARRQTDRQTGADVLQASHRIRQQP